MNLHTNKNSNSATTTIGGFDYLESFIARIKHLDSSLYLFLEQEQLESANKIKQIIDVLSQKA